jgi:hypothetical protein
MFAREVVVVTITLSQARGAAFRGERCGVCGDHTVTTAHGQPLRTMTGMWRQASEQGRETSSCYAAQHLSTMLFLASP